MTRLITALALTFALGACSARSGQPVVRPQGVPATQSQEATSTPTTNETTPQAQADPQGEPAPQPPTGTTSEATESVGGGKALKPSRIPRGSLIFTVFNNVTEATCTVVKDGEDWCSNTAENQRCTEVHTNRSRSARQVTYVATCVDADGQSLGMSTKSIRVPAYRVGGSVETKSMTWFIGEGLRRPRRQ